MEISIGVIYPFSLVHTFTFCAQLVVFALFIDDFDKFTVQQEASFNEIVNLMRILANGILIGFLYVYTKMRFSHSKPPKVRGRDEANVYFDQFQKMIA